MISRNGDGGGGGGVVHSILLSVFCRPQPCGPIKVPDAVRGPLTTADVPLAKHGASLGWRKAPGSALRRHRTVGAIGLTWLLRRA